METAHGAFSFVALNSSSFPSLVCQKRHYLCNRPSRQTTDQCRESRRAGADWQREGRVFTPNVETCGLTQLRGPRRFVCPKNQSATAWPMAPRISTQATVRTLPTVRKTWFHVQRPSGSFHVSRECKYGCILAGGHLLICLGNKKESNNVGGSPILRQPRSPTRQTA